ncbi:MAG: hypothetical protein Q9160_006070 [Pyrenula sp. 1 TL-2023]
MDHAKYFTDPPKGILAPKADERRLSIGIIGAGIAGLAAAAGLTKSGHDVEGRFMKGNDLSTFFFDEHSHWPARYGAPGSLFHRVDLHEGLKDLAQRPPSPGEGTAKIRLATAVKAIDTETGVITLESGETIPKDLIVVADGVHSSFVQTITGGEMEALQTGSSAFRFLIPTEKLLENEETRPLFENEPGNVRVAVCGDTRIVWYPCRNYTLQNALVIHPTSLSDPKSAASTPTSSTTSDSSSSPTKEIESWDNSSTLSSLLSVMRSRDFHPSLIAFCALAEDIRLWPLLYRPPIKNWFKGRAVLTGDAAHPMLPHQGQAGAQAIEDGAALSVALSHLPFTSSTPTTVTPSPLPHSLLTSRLTLFQRIRHSRAAAMQIFSNAGQDNQTQAGEAKQFLQETENGDGEGEVHLPETPAEFHEWNFGWDCFRESARVVGQEGGVGGLVW